MMIRRGEGGNEWLSSDDKPSHFVTLGRDTCATGFYGWRRRCLFLVVTILLFLAMLNLALTLWILKVMEFTSSGLGPLKFVQGGMELRGQAMIVDKLIATKIRSRKGQVVRIDGSKNITLNAKTSSGRLTSQLVLGENSIDVTGSTLKVSDIHGRTLFSVDKKEVLIGSESLVISGEGGANFEGSLQTPKVKADSGHELRLESPTRSLDILGTFGVNIVSGAGDISTKALGDIKLQSQTGTVRFEAPHIYLPELKIASLASSIRHNHSYGAHHKQSAAVYQLCICEKGRIFLAPPSGDCVADNDVCR